jgi:hypothetical protein
MLHSGRSSLKIGQFENCARALRRGKEQLRLRFLTPGETIVLVVGSTEYPDLFENA